MPINTITLGTYPRIFVDSTSHCDLQRELTSIIRNTLTDLSVPIIDIYMLSHPYHQHAAGKATERLVIFINGTEGSKNNEPVINDKSTLFGTESPFTKFLPARGDGYIIKSDEGVPVAEWFDDFWELNILFDLFNDSTDLNNKLKIFTAIMKAFNEQVWFPKILASSWKFGNQKEQLYASFSSLIKTQKEKSIAQDRRQISQWENDLAAYQRASKQLYDQIFQKRRQLIANEDYINEILSVLITDLDILVKNEKIKDIRIDQEFITIFTVPLRIYASNHKIYQGGEYTIKINMFTSDVYFDSTCKRRSYWSLKDPHPHVDGQTKKACLGNIDSTVAELCSQMQLYALTMILIDFLESANVADAAGKCVVNWPEIDEEGNPVYTSDCDDDYDDDCDDDYDDDDDDDDNDTCDDCGSIFDGLTQVWNDLCIRDDGTYPINERHVCDDCRDDFYHWSETFHVYLSNEFDD